MDIDKDGIEELLLGANGEIWDGIIYDIYTMKDGQMIHVLDGWERSRYFLCKDGQKLQMNGRAVLLLPVMIIINMMEAVLNVIKKRVTDQQI